MQNIFQYCFFIYLFTFLGNAMTTIIYRLPRNIPISGFIKKPTCGGCNIRLTQMDIFPLYKYFFVSKFCKCGKYPIPKIYPIFEITNIVLSSIIYILWLNNDKFITQAFLMTTTLTILAIYYENKQIYANALWLLCTTGIANLLYKNPNFDILNHFLLIYLAGAIMFYVKKILKSYIDTFDFRFVLILLSISDYKTFILTLPIFILSFIFFHRLSKPVYIANVINGFVFLFIEFVLMKYVKF